MSFQLNGIYRFSATPSSGGDPLYLTVTSAGIVNGAPDAPNVDTQKWRVTQRPDAFYDIVNVGTGKALRILALEGSEQQYTLTINDGAIDTTWDLSFQSNEIIVLQPTTSQFVNQAVDNRVILSERNGSENQLWHCERLKVDLHWVSASNGEIPAGAVVGGWEPDGSTLYVARGVVNIPDYGDSLQPGKASSKFASTGGCIVGWNYQEYQLSEYEVLVGEPETYAWVPYPYPNGGFSLSNVILAGKTMTAFQGGIEDYGPLYVAQAAVDTGLICGKASATWLQGGMWYTHSGVEVLCMGAFNVLCYY